LGLPPERTLLLTVRRLYARMGLENLVRAMAAAAREQPDALLLIGGRGPLQTRLQELIDEHALAEHVHLLGYIADERLPLYYQAADCFVLPSVELEGFGLATLEALACGTPVLGTAVGGTVEVLGNLDRRLLLKSPAAEDIAAGILGHLAAPPVTREQCRRYAEEHYSWSRMVVQLERLFSDVIGPRDAEHHA
jgi:glycosyltransferase involved in cell wall biosynthesis